VNPKSGSSPSDYQVDAAPYKRNYAVAAEEFFQILAFFANRSAASSGARAGRRAPELAPEEDVKLPWREKMYPDIRIAA
jgi:hypothetical protein